MDNYQETFNTWNKVASLYEEKFMNLDLYDETYDCFLELLPQTPVKLLEIGCGPGNITKYFLSKRPDLKIVGTDVAPNMIELARKNNPSAEFLVLDSREIDTLNTKFDALACGFVLPYLSESDIKKLIQDCANLLNDHGLIYISFVEGTAQQSEFKVGSDGDRVYFHYHELMNLKALLAENTIEVLNVSKVNYKKSETSSENHTILIAKKI